MKGGFIMRLQLKKFIAVTLCLSVVLSSCTIRPGNHSKEALSQRPVSTVDTTGLTLKPLSLLCWRGRPQLW